MMRMVYERPRPNAQCLVWDDEKKVWNLYTYIDGCIGEEHWLDYKGERVEINLNEFWTHCPDDPNNEKDYTVQVGNVLVKEDDLVEFMTNNLYLDTFDDPEDSDWTNIEVRYGRDIIIAEDSVYTPSDDDDDEDGWNEGEGY